MAFFPVFFRFCISLIKNSLHFFKKILQLCKVQGACAMVHMWRAEDNFRESVLSFRLYVGPKDSTQVISLVQQALSLLRISLALPVHSSLVVGDKVSVHSSGWPRACSRLA